MTTLYGLTIRRVGCLVFPDAAFRADTHALQAADTGVAVLDLYMAMAKDVYFAQYILWASLDTLPAGNTVVRIDTDKFRLATGAEFVYYSHCFLIAKLQNPLQREYDLSMETVGLFTVFTSEFPWAFPYMPAKQSREIGIILIAETKGYLLSGEVGIYHFPFCTQQCK